MLVIVQAAFLNPEARNLVAARVQAQGLGPSTEERNIDRVLGSTVE